MPTVPTPHDHALPTETLDEKDARLNPLGPLREVIARTMRTTPVTLGPGGTDALVDELTLAVALYTAREVLPAGLLGAAEPAADEPDQRPAPVSDEGLPAELLVTASGTPGDETYKPALCGCGNPTHSPLTECPPPVYWAPCTPAFLRLHPGACQTALRLPGNGGWYTHFHPQPDRTQES